MAKVGTVEIEVVIKLSLWSAIKLRIAGVANCIEKEIKKKEFSIREK